MPSPAPIDTTDLTSIKATPTKNENLKTLIAEVEAYNAILKQKVRPLSKMVGALDNAMVAAAYWLTAKPKTGTDKNTKRREAVLNIAKEISTTFAQCFGIRPVVGDFGKPGGKGDGNYWLERIDPKNRAGFILLPHYDKWVNKVPQPFEPFQPFWSYLDTVDQTKENKAWALDQKLQMDASLTEDDKAKAEAELKKIREEIATLKKNVAQLTIDTRAPYLVRCVGGKLVDPDGNAFTTKNLKTHFSGAGWAIFVVALNNDIYSFSHLKGEFHHSTFLAGAPVKAAGELVVEDGKVVVITAKSGHYKPKPEDLQKFVKFLQASQVLDKEAVVCAAFGGAFQTSAEFMAKGAAGKHIPPHEVWEVLPKTAQSEEVREGLTVHLLPDDAARATKINGDPTWGITAQREKVFTVRVTAVAAKTPGSRNGFKADDLILTSKATTPGKQYTYFLKHADGTEEEVGLTKK